MTCSIEVLFTPADYEMLPKRDLSRTTCVVLDIFRATSTMVTALSSGALGIIPVIDIPTALSWKERYPEAMLAGERDGVRIRSFQTGSVDFDLGNSPREFTRERVGGRLIVCTTTNGTRALRVCAGAEKVYAGSFLNQTATAHQLQSRGPERICIVCAGTGENAALEDALAAGAFCDQLARSMPGSSLADSALIALGLYRNARGDLADALRQASNARRLLCMAELSDDVEFCSRQDVFGFAAAFGGDGLLRLS